MQLSTDNKKLLNVTKRLHIVTVGLSKDQRNQVIGMLTAGSTVNDIAHHFGCSRQTIHDLMNGYNRTGSVKVCARPGCARVTALRHYHVDTSTHPRNRFNQQPLLLGVYRVHAQKIINHFMQITDLALPSPASSPVMNSIDHAFDELGRRVRPNHQVDAINDVNMNLC